MIDSKLFSTFRPLKQSAGQSRPRSINEPRNIGPLTIREAAHAAGVPMAWLRKEAKDGRVPCLQAGNRFLFDEKALLESLRLRAAAVKDSTPSQSE